MIHDIVTQLGAYLLAQGVPLKVLDGPELASTTYARERIVIEHTDSADKYGPAMSTRANLKHRRTRTPTYKLTLYAQAASPGAAVFEHRRRAEDLLEMILVAMDNVAASMLNRANGWNPISSKLAPPKDLEKSERPTGAVYELLFTFDRPVVVQTFAGAARPTFTTSSGFMTSTTRVSQASGADDDDDDSTVPATAETACGA